MLKKSHHPIAEIFRHLVKSKIYEGKYSLFGMLKHAEIVETFQESVIIYERENDGRTT